MSEIKSVAVAGASGNLGPFVVKALTDAGFQVTVLTRSAKPSAADSNVKTIEVDFADPKSLTAALKGIDGVVSTVAGAAIESQTVIIDAAIAAGVKRFIPSEFGSCTTTPELAQFPVYSSVTKIKDYLRQHESQISWTVLAPGAFTEFLFNAPHFFDFHNHKVTLYDGGDNRVSSTSFPSIGQSIAAIFKKPEPTKNRAVFVSQTIITQNKILAIAKSLQPDAVWETNTVTANSILEEALDNEKKGDYSMETLMKVVFATVFAGDRFGAAFDKTDNELLGIKEFTEDEIKAFVSKALGI